MAKVSIPPLSDKEADSRKEGETRARAFVQMYKDSHPDGPYPALEVEPRSAVPPTQARQRDARNSAPEGKAAHDSLQIGGSVART